MKEDTQEDTQPVVALETAPLLRATVYATRLGHPVVALETARLLRRLCDGPERTTQPRQVLTSAAHNLRSAKQ
jgi:hypothetical protein